jgi:hypothetical protein
VIAWKAAEKGVKSGKICISEGKGREIKGRMAESRQTQGDTLCPGPTSVAVDSPQDPLGTELVVSDSKILWRV